MSRRMWIAAAIAMLLVSPRIRAAGRPPGSITITSLRDGAVFPRDFAPPVIRWTDASPAKRWQVIVDVPGIKPLEIPCDKPEWRPTRERWREIKASSLKSSARLTIRGLASRSGVEEAVSEGTVSFSTSPDPVAASVFFREVPLPVAFAMDNKPLIKWKVADLTSGEPPRTVLSGMRTCANCHSFSSDAKTLAMDIDFGADKGAYAIAPIGKTVEIGRSQMMTWNDYRPQDKEPTFGLFSAITPNGRKVVSTVDETIVLSFMPDLYCSQLFFPVRGILVAYDRKEKTFEPIRGADDPAYVQTSANFSPDGKTLIYARASVPDIPREGVAVKPDALASVVADYQSGRRKILFDLYRVPFNNGRGGTPEPVPGASGNGKSNYFARYSPDGRWIVFCESESMMLLRSDAELYIIPAAGGTPRRLISNTAGRMNSWHSFSPNGRWLVFASKATGPYTQMWLTHIDREGRDNPPIMLDGYVDPERAANIPEFVKLAPGELQAINIADEIRNSMPPLPSPPK